MTDFFINIATLSCIIACLLLNAKRNSDLILLREKMENRHRECLDILNALWAELRHQKKQADGLFIKTQVDSKINSKLSSRAFDMASNANLACVGLQKSLASRPKPLTKEQLLKNELAKKEVDALFGSSDGYEWLYPVLSKEEIDIAEKAKDHHQRFMNQTKY